MTVKDWITSRKPQAPPALLQQVLAALGEDAEVPESRTLDVCLAAAARSLAGLLSERRFARDSALELLAIDALTTFAFEHASESAPETGLEEMATRGVSLFGQLASQRV